MHVVNTSNNSIVIVTYWGDYRRGLDEGMDLLTIYTHDSELQTITAPPISSTIHKSPQHPLSLFPAYCVFTNCSLVTASNSGDPRAQVPFSQPSVRNSTALTWSPQLPSR
jgi:hypothetical protein